MMKLVDDENTITKMHGWNSNINYVSSINQVNLGFKIESGQNYKPQLLQFSASPEKSLICVTEVVQRSQSAFSRKQVSGQVTQNVGNDLFDFLKRRARVLVASVGIHRICFYEVALPRFALKIIKMLFSSGLYMLLNFCPRHKKVKADGVFFSGGRRLSKAERVKKIPECLVCLKMLCREMKKKMI